MKKLFLSVVFIAVGSGLWWLLSVTRYASVKKWDANFNTAIQHSLNEMGFKADDIVAGFNRLQTDQDGEFVVSHRHLKEASFEQITRLKKDLETAGADVLVQKQGDAYLVQIKRGRRVYQELLFQP